MQNLDATIYPVITVLLAVGVVYLALQILTTRAKRRTAELTFAKTALLDHYAAMSRVVDDPAVPLQLLDFLVKFSEKLQNQEFCKAVVDGVALGEEPPKSFSAGDVLAAMEQLRAHRSDLSDDIFRAFSSGIAVMFMRWPGQYDKFLKIFAEIDGDRRKTVAVAYKMTKHQYNGGSDHGLGNHVAA